MLTLAGLALALAVLYRYEPTGSSLYPRCPSYSLTGLLCPGCGTLRALHRLLHGDLAGALRMNPLMVLALFPLLGAWWVSWRSQAQGRPQPPWLAAPATAWSALAVLLVYTALRNLPWHPFTLLAPH